MRAPILQIDAFTDVPFRGNPAAVCVLDEAPDDAWMRDVAREMNLSETAFLVPLGRFSGSVDRKVIVDSPHAFDLRWLTPAVEVALCGHATLASAHALWETGRVPPGESATFVTKSGVLSAVRLPDGWIELDFPAKLESAETAPEGLEAALGVRARYVGKNQFDYLVLVESEQELRSLQPNHAMLRTLPVRGVIVTSPSSSASFDFVSRFFAPGSGVDEDPVTGSAHCCLAPFWGARLGKTEMTGFQASARGGVVRVRLAGNRVKLGGQAVTVLTGELRG